MFGTAVNDCDDKFKCFIDPSFIRWFFLRKSRYSWFIKCWSNMGCLALATMVVTCGNYHIPMIACMHPNDLHWFDSDFSKNIYPLITFLCLTLSLRINLHADCLWRDMSQSMMLHPGNSDRNNNILQNSKPEYDLLWLNYLNILMDYPYANGLTLYLCPHAHLLIQFISELQKLLTWLVITLLYLHLCFVKSPIPFQAKLNNTSVYCLNSKVHPGMMAVKGEKEPSK